MSVYIYIYIYIYIHTHMYIEREIYMYSACVRACVRACVHTLHYIALPCMTYIHAYSIHTCVRSLLQGASQSGRLCLGLSRSAEASTTNPHQCPPTGGFQKCTSKGIGRQGIVLKHRNSLQKEHAPCRHMSLLVQLWGSENGDPTNKSCKQHFYC